ncbi:MAG: hypothetical protein J6R67_06650 [Treponema sp.]|nr:hypothetical protein [Treponema sp.]
MPWKLVGFIICLVLGTCFAGYNLGNNCNISFGFHTFENVPIFFSLIVAFACGVVVTLPFTVIRKKSTKEKKALAEERAMKKIKKDQEKEAKALVVAEKAAAKEAKLAQKEAKKQEKAKKQEIVAETPAPSVEPGEKV